MKGQFLFLCHKTKIEKRALFIAQALFFMELFLLDGQMTVIKKNHNRP